MRKHLKSKSGQTMVEYIIIVVIIAITAIAVVGFFSDRIRKMFGGAAVELGADEADSTTAVGGESAEWIKGLDETGHE